MLGSFRIRLLIVIVLVAMVGLIMQSGHSSKEVVAPVLHYMMDTDYEIDKAFSTYIHKPDEDKMRALPTITGSVLKMPCDFVDIERNYGWHWSKEVEKTEFCPGIYFKVEDNTPVKPILPGYVEDLRLGQNNGTVRIKHAGNLVSVYGGLKEITVEKETRVAENQTIGKTGQRFYFEVRTQDGPVNPQSIFK